MNKGDFLSALSEKLSSLPKNEIEKSLLYYEEIINDRVEDNMTEEEAVAALGDIGGIANDIMYGMSIPALMKAKVSESKNNASNPILWLILVILGFPLWFPLLMAFFAVFIALYGTVWTVILALYIVVLALGAGSAAGIVSAITLIFTGSFAPGLFNLGLAVIAGAVAVFMIIPVWLITLALLKFTSFIARKIKSLFIKRSQP